MNNPSLSLYRVTWMVQDAIPFVMDVEAYTPHQAKFRFRDHLYATQGIVADFGGYERKSDEDVRVKRLGSVR